MKTPAFLSPPAVARFALALLAVAVAPALGQTRGQRAYSPNNPLDMAQRELDKAETDAVRFDPQSPERNAIEGRAQQLRAQMAGSVLIYGAGVNKPGLYQPTPGLTVTEAIKLAGGTTPDADVTRVNLTFTTYRLGFSQDGGREVPTQHSAAGIDLTNIKPMPAGILPDGFPPARTSVASRDSRYVIFSYDFMVVAGDAIRIDATEFRFEGGTPKDFLKAIDAHYLTAWQDLANIPPEGAEIKVPKIITSLRQTVVRQGIEEVSSKPARALLELYNALAADQPALGKWKMPEPLSASGGGRIGGGRGSLPPPPHPDLILPEPAPTSGYRYGSSGAWLRDLAATTAGQTLRAKVLSLAPIPHASWEALTQDIANIVSETARLAGYEAVRRGTSEAGQPSGLSGISLDGRVQLSPGPGVLLVVGTPEYIDLVESFVAAKRAEAERAKAP